MIGRPAVMDHNREQYVAADAREASTLDGPEWATASPVERKRAELAVAAKRKALREAFLARQRGFVEAAEAQWKANLPAVLQRKAALDNPSRASAIKELARGAGPAELQALAEALVQAGDAAGAYGLRLSLTGRDDAESLGPVLQTALTAGTEAHKPALRELLRCKQAWAASVGAADGMLDPAAVLTAANAAHEIPAADGGVRRVSAREVAEILAD